jgi:hypothetical protein
MFHDENQPESFWKSGKQAKASSPKTGRSQQVRHPFWEKLTCLLEDKSLDAHS